MTITVYGARHSGSVIVELALDLAKIPYVVEEIAYDKPGPQRDVLFDVNPIGQVPAVRLDDGTILTETLAIIQAIDDMAPEAGLVPARGEPERNRYLRWSTYLVAAVYPTFTFGDEPDRWLRPFPEAQKQLRRSTDERREALWSVMEDEADPTGPWFLGQRFSAIDLYLAVMLGWRPGREWFEKKTPRLTRAAVAARARPEVSRALAR
ncbi:MAG: glutathione S-transferase family protein [Myxococcota bacterium]